MSLQRWTRTLIAQDRMRLLEVLGDGEPRTLYTLEAQCGLTTGSCYRAVRSLEDRRLVRVDRTGPRCVVSVVYPPLVTTANRPMSKDVH